ncbi:SAV_6107 family HEPN domain-containing protein [Corynebacterium otitidis]|uniref:SAV-6107-like HEPN domain-containing protein n=1 Tax=Corynebacterium otitidis ATCC 51513 TaxID=883169 RepID=K0YTC4_9CORY|nr:SAV_6107 family HEPN domain-containing protein [Corynebacterium otitidis]EJZ82774.1 hypothetical protein HMPREF9719_00266 [Corynebacterium otitidis ATCC 51513]
MVATISAQGKLRGQLKRDRVRTSRLDRAAALLSEAHARLAAGEPADAVELAYQAALRAAGAVVAGAGMTGRRRAPSNAWDKLRMVSPEAAAWADRLSSYSRLRGRLLSGLEAGVEPATAERLAADAAALLDWAEGEH